MTKTNTKKLAVAGVFCAVAVVGSLFSFPVLGSKCSPVQHMVNILCGVLLGPGYGLGAAFAAALIRNLLGLGSLLAFPGSMFGALVCGLVYARTKSILGTLLGEVFGTAIRSGLCVRGRFSGRHHSDRLRSGQRNRRKQRPREDHGLRWGHDRYDAGRRLSVHGGIAGGSCHFGGGAGRHHSFRQEKGRCKVLRRSITREITVKKEW